uniref:Trichohyalin-like n=1 Tax=Saccoglossus kowalevskii TaxID=10224 RepID=A0ABM0MTI4_SACKO|nr:PREDICTED: trichohyalin-like [Saccoglossus kowalevskii]
MPIQDLSTLIRWQEEQIKERKEKKNDNIVIILLRRDECNKTGEDELVEALKDKYDVLRDKLIAEALMKQMSEAEWNRLSEKERQERILKMKLELRRLLEEGKQDEVARLLGDVIETQNALESLMGENRAEYERKLKERLARRKARLAKGMSESEVIKLESIEELAEEEELKKKPKPKNILKDLDRRYDEEKAALLASLKGQDDRLLSERLRQAELSRLKREQRITREEDKFEAAAILLGLAEHYGDVEARKRLRQEELAKQRLAERKNRRADAKKRLATIEEEVVTMPENEDDVIALQDAVLNEVNKKHRAERELLIALLQEQENSKHKKTAKDMNEDELYNKLNELKSYRAQWRESSSDPSQQIQIFEVCLLADLQQEQDKESRHLMADLHSQSAATLRQLKQAEMIARSQKWYDNVASIMFGIAHQQLTSEDELVEALEEKYDALRDKLLAEALMRQFSETQWAKMSEKERQAKLMKLKLEEKRLRREGKFDEAAALLGDSFKNDEELARILGESEKTQKERLKERLERRRQLKAERKAEGLPVDDKSLDEILDAEEEEEKKRRRNILLELNNHFEDEKDALMAALRAQDKRLMSERERQLALAKLRRDQLKLKKEDSFETAAVLYGIAQDNEAKRQTGVGKDRERQRQLARQRLAAAKKKRSTKNALKKAALEKKLKQDEEENVKSDAMLALRRQQEGVAVLQEAVLTELEKKHKTESDMLLILINHAEENKKEKEAAKKLSDEELNKKLRKLESKRDRWRRQSQKDADIADYHNLSPSELGKHLTKLAANQEKQYDILEVAVLLKMEELRRSTAADGSVPEKNIESEVQVKLLSDVQEKQQAESNAMSKILGSDKAERIFEKLKEDQRRARREGWFDNMASSVLDSDPLQVTRSESMISIRSEDIHELEGEIEDLDIKHERNIQEVKGKKRARREGNKIDANAMLAELERQHAAKKKAMKEQLEKQKQKMKERLAAKKHAKDEKEYEEVIALALLKNAERTLKLQEQKDSEEKDRQGIMMKEKLKSRREQRREAQNARDEAQTMKEHEELEKKKREMDAEKRLVEEEAAKHPQKLTSAKKSDVYPDLPGGPMRRQKTVVDINVSEEKKKQILSTLVSEQTKAQQTIEKEQMKQAEMLKEKLEKHKSRRQDEAAAVVGLGARQKTILEKTQKDERERQITMVKERIARVRYERTMTMKERANKNTADFEKMLSPDDPNGTPSDEKMSKLAADLNQRFKKDEMDIKKGVKSMLAEDNVPEGKSKPKKTVTIDDGTKSSRKIDDKEKERIMKERLAQRRKKQFVKKGSLAAAPDMDTLSKRIQEQNASEKNEGE